MPGYTLSDGVTLKNKLGLTTHESLEAAETDFVRNRLWDFASGQGPPGSFDAEHLKAIHRHLFQDVYEWAGHTRDERVALSDGAIATEPTLRKVDGKPFMAGTLIAEGLDGIMRRLAEADYLRGLSRTDFANRAADTMVDLNAVHPFREGNGRTQRVFIETLAHHAGHALDFTVVSRERMIQASIAGHEYGDPTRMRRLFGEIGAPERVAALSRAIGAMERHGFRWNDCYVATAEPGHRVTARLAGIAGDQFMARTHTSVLIGRTNDLPEPRPEQGREFSFVPGEWS